mmetsp:Transcript_5822/g.11387  ORF Transcript_5822/g.11387 Transcript_5822/m.11387 type:complete len:203 (-) Transcript_5822:230-838(-)|eukprot:scaffold4599_cov219-Amphora_coffeaeformis.AAC.15
MKFFSYTTGTALVLALGLHVALVQADLDTTPNDEASQTLYQAALDNDKDAIAAALAVGGDINVRDNASGQTALMAASLRGKAGAVGFLLKHGADPSIPEKDGYTPPHGAGFQGRAEVLRLLKGHGLDVINTPHKDGFLPFHRACWGREARHTNTVRVFVEDFGIDPKIPGGPNKQTCFDMSPNSQTKWFLREREVEERHKEL